MWWAGKIRRDIEARSIDFEYRQIDEREIADHIHQRMASSGTDTHHYLLPVVEASGRVQVRPELEWVVEQL